MRVSAIFFSWAMRAASIASRDGDIGLLDGAVAGDFERADALFLGDAAGLGGFARRDAGDLERLVAIDLELAACSARRRCGSAASVCSRAMLRGFDRLLRVDLGFLDGCASCSISSARVRSSEAMRSALTAVIWAMRSLFGCLPGGDLGLVDGARALDLAPAGLLLVGDAGSVTARSCWMRAFSTDFAGLRSRPPRRRGSARSRVCRTSRSEAMRAVSTERWLAMRAFSISFARGDLPLLDRRRALDLLLAGLALGGDARFGDRLLVGDARLLDRLARRDLRLLGFGLAQRALARHLGALQRAAHLDVALLLKTRCLALALDIERLPLGLEIAGADLDHRILFDVVAQLARGPRCPRISRVRPSASKRFEGLKNSRSVWSRSVIATDFELEAVLGQRLRSRGLRPARHIRRAARASRSMVISEATERSAETNLPDSSACSRSGSSVRRPSVAAAIETASRVGCDADIEVGLDVDAHAVAGDDGVLLRRARSASAARSC